MALTEAFRILLYSHDTFGLGHLRRNCKIANALAAALPEARILIATGSPKAGSFALDDRIELVRLPGIYKVTDGSYRSGETGRSSQVLLEERSRIIAQTARMLQPQLFIADKEPLGLLGELEETLHVLRALGSYLVLGLRDVLDEPHILRQEWDKKNITPQIDDLYDAFWVYGPRDFHDPLAGLDLSPSVIERTHFLGFIDAPARKEAEPRLPGLPPEYLLVTAGGGGDGHDLMTAVLAAYERGPAVPLPPVFLLGPFMNASDSDDVRARASEISGAMVIDFANRPEPLLAGAAGVVAMCGYNTFCEIVAQDKPALFIPRERPRLEQFIRAEHGSRLGLCTMMRSADALGDPAPLAAALRALPDGPRPSKATATMAMNGLDMLCELVRERLNFDEDLGRALNA